jgi:hypothetical protein
MDERELFRRMTDGRADEAAFRQFEERLAKDPELRKRYVLFMGLEANLYEALSSRPAQFTKSPRERVASSIWKRGGLSAVCLVVGLLAGLLWQRPHKEALDNVGHNQSDIGSSVSPAGHAAIDLAKDREMDSSRFYLSETGDVTASNIALVTYARFESSPEAARWFYVGRNLHSGVLHVPAGELQLDFLNGAQLLIEGPAQLRLHAVDAVTLIAGNAAARVPDSARGFVLNAPGMAVVDLGTEFSLKVDDTGVSHVQVTEGEVEVSLLGQDGSTVQSERLKDSAAVRVSNRQKSLEAVAMVTPSELVIPVRPAAHLQVSEEYVEAVKQSRPFAYWRFEEMQGGLVKNEMGSDFPARLVADPTSETVRVENGRAVFQAGQHPRYFTVEEGISGWNRESFTVEMLGCPLRLHHGALIDILSEDWTGDLNTIEVAMKTSMIHPAGALRFFHRHPPGQDSRSGLNLFDQHTCVPGRWFHVVCVKTKSSLAMSINGREVRRIEGPMGSDDAVYQICLGQMDNKSLHRQFEGAIDEVALYNRALNQDEIQRHFELLNLSP